MESEFGDPENPLLMRLYMDRKIKDLQKSTKQLVKKEESFLKEDKKHNKVIDKAKKNEGE